MRTRLPVTGEAQRVLLRHIPDDEVVEEVPWTLFGLLRLWDYCKHLEMEMTAEVLSALPLISATR